MIDRLRSIAQSAKRLAAPALAIALLCFVYATFIAFTSTSVEDDKYLFPSILGFMWMLSFYAFVETFRYVPQRSKSTLGFYARAKQKLSRFWYWIIGLIFLASSAAVAVFTVRVLVVWFRNYGD
jgi:hypothetical protein